MPPDFEVLHQILNDPWLDLVGFNREPAYIAPFRCSNELQRALAHLVAYDGNYSRPVKCTSSGILKTALYDAAGGKVVEIDTNGWLGTRIKGISGQAGVDDGTSQTPSDNGLWVWDYYTRMLYTILSDCWNATNHSLRTSAA